MIGLEHVLRTMTRDRMEHIGEHSPNFATRVNLDEWRMIPKEALQGVSPSLVNRLAILSLLNDDDLKHLPDDVFANIGADDLHRIKNLPAIRPDQLANLGIKVPYEKAPGLAIKETDFIALCASRVHLLKMPLQVIGPMPELFCQHLDTPAKFSYLPPSSLIYMNSYCLDYLPARTYAGITISQSHEISSGLPQSTLADEIDSPLYFLVYEQDSQNYISLRCLRIIFMRLNNIMTEHVKKHGPLERNASPPSPTYTFLETAILALGIADIIGLLVFFLI